MCELFGFCGSQPVSLNRELEAFYAHADEHPNGWGLALLDQDCFSIEKENKFSQSERKRHRYVDYKSPLRYSWSQAPATQNHQQSILLVGL